MNGRLLALLGAVAGLGLAAPTSMAARTQSRDFTYSGTCVDLVFPIPVDAKRVERFVPNEFSVLVIGGKANLFATAVSCDDTVVDGKTAPHAIYSDMLVQIESPDGQPGLDGYWIWQVTDSRRVRSRLRRIGMFGARDLRMRFKPAEAEPGANDLVARVRWHHSPYAFRGTFLDTPSTGGLEFPTRFWHLGRHGTVRATNHFTDSTIDPIEVELRAKRGSPLAKMLGSNRVSGLAGVEPRVQFVQTVELVSRRRSRSRDASRRRVAPSGSPRDGQRSAP